MVNAKENYSNECIADDTIQNVYLELNGIYSPIYRPFSLILPCKNDSFLLKKLLFMIEDMDREIFPVKHLEIIVIDGSTDNESKRIIEKLPELFSNLNIRIIKAIPGTRLLRSELIGLKVAKYGWRVVMDCDLQHSPMDIIKLLEI